MAPVPPFDQVRRVGRRLRAVDRVVHRGLQSVFKVVHRWCAPSVLMAAAVAAELTKEPGFLSWVGLGIADRLYTITVWESEEAVRAVMRTSAHKDAVKRFFSGDVGAAASTGVWIPHHLNAVRVRCPACGVLIDRAKADGTCACGETLPEAPEYW